VKTTNGIVDDQTPLVRALIVLTVVTGLVDAISFLGLGHIFTANMTGNIVFLGFAAGGAPGISAVRSIAALCAFAGGSACGGRLTGSRERTPAGHLLIATYVETALLLTAAIAAAFAASHVPPAIAYTIVLSTAMAMGLRNAVVRKLAVPDLTTTVLTLTLSGTGCGLFIAGRRTVGVDGLSIPIVKVVYFHCSDGRCAYTGRDSLGVGFERGSERFPE
jgi:uncharacterized membrane protein YoaK (UPF0700 family)